MNRLSRLYRELRFAGATMRKGYQLGSLICLFLWLPFSAVAGEPVITEVVATPSSAGGYNFSVTVQHDDTGWAHYADKWVVMTPDGETRLGERVLFHPHVHEQPFTRSLRSVVVPKEYDEVLLRVHDRKDGWSSKEFRLKLPDRQKSRQKSR